LEVVTRCKFVIMTFGLGSWSSMGAKFRAPLNLESLLQNYNQKVVYVKSVKGTH